MIVTEPTCEDSAADAQAKPACVRDESVRSILFVDDEPLYLEMARDLFPAMRPDWEFRFARDAREALAELESAPASVIVTDYVMPGMNGRELLDCVRERFPDTMRIMLSGLAESQRVVDAAGSGHEYLPKPCEPNLLLQTIDRACYLRERVQSKSIRRLIAQTSSLPSLPPLYAQLLSELNSANPSMDRVAEIIAQDVAMTAKVLHVVNLSAFGLHQQITDAGEAVLYLGATAVQSLMVSHQITSHYEAALGPGQNRFLTELWSHSLETALCARWLCRTQHTCSIVQSQAYAGGLLHDIGKLMLAANFPTQFAQAQKAARAQGVPLWKAEWEVFGTTHAEAGAYLLALWNLPDPIVSAIHCHHEPKNESRIYWSRTFSPVTAVHIANAVVQLHEPDRSAQPDELLDMRYLRSLGVDGKIDAWLDHYADAQDLSGG